MKNLLPAICLLSLAAACANCGNSKKTPASYEGSAKTSNYDEQNLPAPYATKSVKNFSEVVGWKDAEMPTAPKGFAVQKWADALDHPRWMYVADNGDIFVAEATTKLTGIQKLGKLDKRINSQGYGESANRISLFRDANKDGIPEKRNVYLTGLNQPFGMLIIGNHFYVANTDGLIQFDYNPKDTVITSPGKKILALSATDPNRHWTRNLIANKQKTKIYIAVGSASNVAENGIETEEKRACIIEVNPDGSGEKIYASGLRNPVGMDWAPGTNVLWTAVNERDELGDELVPDYLTSVKEDGFYGWPYSYFGQNEDPRMKDKQRPDLVKKAIKPDVALGSHTASLGLAFYDKKAFPGKYHGGAFIAQHGSWNRSVLSGYKVVYVPFKNGKPSGPPEDFLTGFVSNLDKSQVRGRPVGVVILDDGSMLVTDDSSSRIWRVVAQN